MKKLLFLTAFVFALLGVATATNAYTEESDISVSGSASTDVNIKPEGPRPAPLYKELRDKAELEARRVASTTRGEIMEKRDNIRNELRDKASTTRSEIKEKRDEIRGEIKEKASTTRAEIKDRRDEFKTEVRDRILANLKEKITKTSAQLVAMVGRLSSVADKVDSRIVKMKESGKDVSIATGAMVDVRAKISSADLSAKAVANVNASTTDPRSSLESLKSAVESAKTALKSAHEALVNVVNSLKPGINATSTASVN